MKRYFFVFLIFIFLISGCMSFETVESTKVSPSEISQTYKISSTKDSTIVIATFYANGATVDLDVPSFVEFNGAEMRESKPSFLKGTDYRYDSGKFESDFQFAFHAADGKIYRNEIYVAPLEIATENLNLSRSQNALVKLSRPVEKDESVSFSLRSAEARVTPTNSNAANDDVSKPDPEIYSAEGTADLDSSRTNFSIDRDRIKNFAPGKATLAIEVSKNVNIQQSTGRGGSLSSTYQAQNVSVSIVR